MMSPGLSERILAVSWGSYMGINGDNGGISSCWRSLQEIDSLEMVMELNLPYPLVMTVT